MASKFFVVLDMEHIAYGGGKTGPIIQVGVVKMDGVTGQVVDKDQWDIRTDVPCTDLTTKITGITQQDIDSGVSLTKVTKLLKTKYGTNVTYYAWGSDCAILNRHSLQQRGCAPIVHMIDFQHMYQTFIPGSDAVGLKTAMKNHGLEFIGNHHQAMDDAYNTARLIHTVMSKLIINTSPENPVKSE